MSDWIEFIFVETTFQEAFRDDPVMTVVKLVVLLICTLVIVIITAFVGSKFATKPPANVVNSVSYGHGGKGGSGGGQGGRGGNTTNIQGFPFIPGKYHIKIGKGGGPGQDGEESSITLPTGEVIVVSGGQGGNRSEEPSAKS